MRPSPGRQPQRIPPRPFIGICSATFTASPFNIAAKHRCPSRPDSMRKNAASVSSVYEVLRYTVPFWNSAPTSHFSSDFSLSHEALRAGLSNFPKSHLKYPLPHNTGAQRLLNRCLTRNLCSTQTRKTPRPIVQLTNLPQLTIPFGKFAAGSGI